jgi:hypothetical protein
MGESSTGERVAPRSDDQRRDRIGLGVDRALRRLPFHTRLVEGEAFASYVDRIAVEHECASREVLEAAGVLSAAWASRFFGAYGVMLPRPLLTAFADAAGVEPAAVQGMHLDHYDKRAFSLSGFSWERPQTLQRVSTREWIYIKGSHACPQCLHESDGAWQLSWKLPYSFACARHRVLLVDRCDRCGRRLGSRAVSRLLRDSIPSPHLCRYATRAGGDPIPCGLDLTRARTLKLGRHAAIIDAQVTLDTVLAEDCGIIGGEGVPALDYLQGVRCLSALILRHAEGVDMASSPRPLREAFASHLERRERARSERTSVRTTGGSANAGPHAMSYKGVPTSAALMAAVAPICVRAFARSNTVELGDDLGWLIERILASKPKLLRRHLNDLPMPQPLAAAIDDHLRRDAPFSVRFGVRGASPLRTFSTYSVDAVPQLVPRALAESEFGEMFTTLMPYRLLFCSMALVMRTGVYRSAGAGEALGHPGGKSAQQLAVAELEAKGMSGQFDSAVQRLAERLSGEDASPSFGDRRRAFDSLTYVDRGAWRRICSHSGVGAGPSDRRRWAALWLWQLLTSGDYRAAPAFPRTDRWASGYGRFVRDELPPIRGALTAYGEELLDHAGLAGPLTQSFLGCPSDADPASPTDVWRRRADARWPAKPGRSAGPDQAPPETLDSALMEQVRKAGRNSAGPRMDGRGHRARP